MYELYKYVDFQKLLNDNEYAESKSLKVKKYNGLNLIKYDKKKLNWDNISTLGLFRSVICNDEKILSFSPPKSVNLKEINNLSEYNFENFKLEEFVEGTMINVFWNESKNDWDLATRSNIGAKCSFNMNYEQKNTFRYMFLDAMNYTNLDFDNLNKSYSYSFILQHPENRIVVPFNTRKLYLVGVYSFNNYVVKLEKNELDRITKNINENSFNIYKPLSFEVVINEKLESFEDVLNFFNTTHDLDYKILGCVLKSDYKRLKIRNKNYETVRHLKGNTPKLQYQYYCLRRENKVKDFLDYYPDNKNLFQRFRSDLHEWTSKLHHYYLDCFVFKTKSLKEYPYEFKPHLYELHKLYIDELRMKSVNISKAIVINYVNNLPPQRLMYSVNYKLKQNIVEEHALNVENMV